MPGLLDIAAAPARVSVRGRDVEVFGIGAEGLAYLLRFPEIVEMFSGNEVQIDVASLAKSGPQVLAAIIACGASLRDGEPPRPGNAQAEEVAASLSLDEQASLLAEILGLTFKRGLGPFVADIQRLTSAVEGVSAAGTKALGSTSQ